MDVVASSGAQEVGNAGQTPVYPCSALCLFMNAMTRTQHAICMPVSLSGVGVVVKAIHRVIETQGKLRLAVNFQLEADRDARDGRQHIHMVW